MTEALHATDRAVLRIAGPDARDFLHGLVTNDVRSLEAGPVYAALLSPQGKYLFDFLLFADTDTPGAVLLDVKADRAAALARRLAMYRLRADVVIAPADLAVAVGTGAPPAPLGTAAFPDPRDPALGWRALVAPADAPPASGPADALLAAARVARAVPETGVELVPDDSYILELGFERLHGVDFRKGCYVGQEVTARMKHRTELRKGLVRVRVDGPAPPPGTAITAGDKTAGTLYTTAGGEGLAWLRLDRAVGPLAAGAATLTVLDGITLA
jgi:tRNA-modifying protein YgfZ